MAIEFFESISSTNDYFKEKSENGTLSKGDAVVAFLQTKGRGRNKRSFSSGNGGIYFSISYGNIKNENIEDYYSLMPSSALHLKNLFQNLLGIETRIKWPNDILKNGKKCTGILAERSKKGDLILGVGINYDNVEFDESLKNIATSLYENKEVPPLSKKDFAKKAVETLLHLELFKNNSLLIKEYNESSETIGTFVNVCSTNGIPLLSGIAEGIDENGELLIRLSDGSLKKCSSGEVTLSKKL